MVMTGASFTITMSHNDCDDVHVCHWWSLQTKEEREGVNTDCYYDAYAPAATLGYRERIQSILMARSANWRAEITKAKY